MLSERQLAGLEQRFQQIARQHGWEMRPSGHLEQVLSQSSTLVLHQAFFSGDLFWFARRQQWVGVPTPPIARSGWPCGLHSGLIPQTTSRHLRGFLFEPALFGGYLKGDLINLVLWAADQSQLQAAFLQAGWSQPELINYLEAPWAAENHFPISRLYLWGRVQDLAFSRDTSFNLAHRHHLRLWRSPWRCQAQEIWVASITRDVGVAWNHLGLANGLTTHRIDPAVDQERDFVLAEFAQYFPLAEQQLLVRPQQRSPLIGMNGNLDPYVSDGRLGWLSLNHQKRPPIGGPKR